MNRYRVQVRETISQFVWVEAETAEKAMEFAVREVERGNRGMVLSHDAKAFLAQRTRTDYRRAGPPVRV